jgi:uncharacterized protein YkwD
MSKPILKFFPFLVLGTVMLVNRQEIWQLLKQSSPIQDSPIVSGSNPVSVQANDVMTLEESVNQQINQYRRSQGLPPLRLDSRISAIALNHSQRMASKQVPFSHNGFKSRYQQIAQVIRSQGVAENIAYNQGSRDPVKTAVQGWLQSSGHHKNIMGQYQITGIGVAKNAGGEYYFTQLFVSVP